MDMQAGFVEPNGKLDRFLRTAIQSRAGRDYDCSVRVPNVPFRALLIMVGVRFDQWILERNQTIFGFSALWAPSAALIRAGERPIKRCPIDTGLAT